MKRAHCRRQPAERALLVCSPGGHLQQMLALREAWDGLAVTWATLPSRDVEHLLAGQDVLLGHGPTNRSLKNLFLNLVFAWRAVRDRKPDVILSTGAALAVPFFLAGWLRGVRLVYVESLTRIEGLSLSGRLVAPLADELFVQWPQAAGGRARYAGSLLEDVGQARVRVMHLGPDAAGRGGMAEVLRGVLASPSAEVHDFDHIATWRSPGRVDRVVVFAKALVKLASWCLRPGPRVVHVHSTVRGSLYRKSIVVRVAKLARRPVIIHMHCSAGDTAAFHDRLGPVRRAFFRRTFALADRVLAVAKATAEAVDRCFGPVDVLVVPNAAPRVDASPPRFGRPDGEVRLLYLGGFENPVKGGETLVRALPSIVAECPTARLELGGPGRPPDSLLRLVEREPRVRWLGWLDEAAKRTALERGDIFLLPSHSEGMPMMLLEAMAHGKATVATRVGGVPEVAADGVTALLVEPSSPEQLASAVAQLVADRRQRTRFGEAARERVKQMNQDEVSAALDRIYRKLAG